VLEEHRRNGAISLRASTGDARGAFSQAFFVYVASMAVAVGLAWEDIVYAVTYTTNYHEDPERSWQLGTFGRWRRGTVFTCCGLLYWPGSGACARDGSR
jgi:hypothetical protein